MVDDTAHSGDSRRRRRDHRMAAVLKRRILGTTANTTSDKDRVGTIGH
jgi:hypothetical protein